MWRRAKSSGARGTEQPPRTEAIAELEAAPPAAVPAAPHGYVDGVVRGQVMGWCWLLGEPDTRLTVEVLIDGEQVISGTADLMRESVAKAGFGDGRYGFRIPLPESLADGGSHRIDVRAGGAQLAASPSFAQAGQQDPEDAWVTTTFTPELIAPARAADGARRKRRGRREEKRPDESAPELRGYVDGIADDAIVGWIIDEARPEQSVPLEAFLDGVFIGSADADVPRLDVARAGYGERHGFHFPLPAPIEPGEYTIEVRTTPEGWRVPLVSDYNIYDEDRRPMSGIVLKEHRISGQRLSHEALLGLDGWMFEWPGSRVFDILTGRQSVPAPVFERQLARIRERRDAARAAGATLIEAVVPAKVAVYTENLPGGVVVNDTGRPASELAAATLDENGVEVIDLAVPLRQCKRHGPIFPRTGRDLTWLGGFTAYRVLAKELAKRHPQIEPMPRTVVELGDLEPMSSSLADLPRLVWIGSRTVPAGPGAHDEEREGLPRLRWNELSAEYAVVPPGLAELAGSGAALLRARDPARASTALVIHDGAAATLLPFLAEHYAQTLVAGGDAELDQLLEAFRPEAVIEIVAERSLLLV